MTISRRTFLASGTAAAAAALATPHRLLARADRAPMRVAIVGTL